eukprot:scaffold208501_cov33-Tisochrysis_lutea.AAC.2
MRQPADGEQRASIPSGRADHERAAHGQANSPNSHIGEAAGAWVVPIRRTPRDIEWGAPPLDEAGWILGGMLGAAGAARNAFG